VGLECRPDGCEVTGEETPSEPESFGGGNEEVPPVDCHDGVFLGEGSRIAPIRTFIELHTPGEGP
jgi:hypothetical protein